MSRPRVLVAFLVTIGVAAGIAFVMWLPPETATPGDPTPDLGLNPAAAFVSIADDRDRAAAMFTEAARVLRHPRCVNCHPSSERPLQGERGDPHQPLVVRGAGGMGAPGMMCLTCHGTQSFQNVPGRPGWVLAPSELAWEAASVAAICEQLKARAASSSLEDIARYVTENELVGHGFAPPTHLEAAPGDQATLGGLFRGWVEAGAYCPG